MIEASYLTLDDRLVFVESCGSGPPVLCLHTAGQSGVQWRHTLTGLAREGFRVVVPDLPGHGRSEPSAGGPVQNLPEYAAWCLRLVDELGLDHPFVLGCSIGGRIALDMATRASDSLAGVVAMAAQAQPGGLLSVGGLERSLEDASSPSRADRTFLGTVEACGRSVPTDRVALIAEMHRREDPYVTTADLIGWFSHDLTNDLHRIGCPTYVVVGDDDFWLDLDQVRWTSERIIGSRHVVLEGIGHYPMEEMADFVPVVSGWLRDLQGDDLRVPGTG